MKVLIIGGTRTISSAVADRLVEKNWEVYVLNRGTGRKKLPDAVRQITVNIDNEASVSEKLENMHFDLVCEFIGSVPAQLERDYRLFNGKTEQYIFINSASAYHKPARSHIITEGTTLANPHWEYSRNKIACEEHLMKLYREEGFPVTIVHPSHTYDERSIPVGAHGSNGSWQVIKRIMEGKPVIVQGDGSSLWTLTYSTDFAVGFVGLMGNPHAIGETFHITGEYVLKSDANLRIVCSEIDFENDAFYEKRAVEPPDPKAYKRTYTIYYNASKIDPFYLCLLMDLELHFQCLN